MTPRCPGAGKGRFWCKTMAQYGTLCNICPPHLTMTYILCHPWHHDGTHVTYDTDIESMTPSWQQWHHNVLELGKDDSGGKQWHNMAQYVIYVTYDTDMESMTLSWQQWHHTVVELGKDDSGVKQWHNMAQYVIYVIPTSTWLMCYVTHDTTMTLMSPMSQTLNQWHTVLELGKGDFGVKQCHNMAQYVIYVLPISPWRICYVTHDTTMALMSPMSELNWTEVYSKPNT